MSESASDPMGKTTDIAIVGAGPVGSTLALALRGSGLSVTLLDAREGAADDRRAIALSYGSGVLLERLGLWQELAATPIETIHVSQRGGFGRTVLSARERGVAALGYVCTYAALDRILAEAVQRARHLVVERPVSVEAMEDNLYGKALTLRKGDAAARMLAQLVIVADGGSLAGSVARRFTRDYGQSAVVATVDCHWAHQNRAFERFTPEGPIALLPVDDHYALVWTSSSAEAERLRDLSAERFLHELQQAFGGRAGRFLSVRDRALFPLSLRFTPFAAQSSVILLGNAAQTLHPVAGQGLNLGLRDAFSLATQLVDRRPEGLRNAARGFATRRAFDRIGTVLLTDLLVTTFSNRLAPIRALRGCALTALDLLPAAKRGFTDRMMFGA